MNENIRYYVDQVEPMILKHLNQNVVSDRILESCTYSIKAGGKKFRPYLLFTVLKSLHTDLNKGLHAASALEMIHTYSLIHDDLPAMDNDDLRRGMPTNHIQFDEGTAILAGDNLLTESFNILSTDLFNEPKVILKLIQLLSFHSGQNGMISGQMLDIEAENSTLDINQLEKIHRYKTGALITASMLMGASIARCDENTYKLIDQLSQIFGILFQIKDDILDVTGTTETLGKSARSDIVNNKLTYTSAYGLEQSINIMNDKKLEAQNIIDNLSNHFDVIYLTQALDKIVNRQN